MDRRPPYSNNVISMRYRRNAGDAAPAPQPSSGASPWSFLALLAVGYGVIEGMKYMAGTHREPVMLPGARLMREPSRIARHNPSGIRTAALLAGGAVVGGVATYGFVNMRQNQAAIAQQNAALGIR